MTKVAIRDAAEMRSTVEKKSLLAHLPFPLIELLGRALYF